jgi:cysteine desulfurase family protein (TIGR01976 family)
MTSPQFPINWIRDSFPALQSADGFIFFDNAAGAQIPQIALEAVRDHLVSRNVQRGGRYRKSREVDEGIQHARETVAMFLNARDSSEVAFGMNATSFIRLVSLALVEVMNSRREIVVSDLDHEANVATWLALQSRGVEIRWWKMREDGTLHTADLEPLLNSRTRLVTCTVASNALGSIVDVKEAAKMAHAAGAEVFLDAVHYAPHGPLDVQDLDCDYLVCSGYKIFAPHMGFLWGKRRLLEALPTFREDFIPNVVPMKIEVGTFVYENVAGMDAAIAYLEDLGSRLLPPTPAASRRARLVGAMDAIREYEASLSRELIRGLSALDHVNIYGLTNPQQMRRRVPTLCFNLRGLDAAAVSAKCAEEGIGVRDGNMYSPRLLRRLGISPEAGVVRASLVHYNTLEEIRRFAEVVQAMARNCSL